MSVGRISTNCSPSQVNIQNNDGHNLRKNLMRGCLAFIGDVFNKLANLKKGGEEEERKVESLVPSGDHDWGE